MAIPQLPNGMNPQISDYSGGDIGGVAITEVEGGSPRTALEYDGGVQPFNVVLFLVPQAYQIWTLFYHRIIKKGAKPFSMILDTGDGDELHPCMMVPGSYSINRNGPISIVTFSVLAEPVAYEYSEADAQGRVDIWNEFGDNTDAIFNRLAIFANVDVLVLKNGT